MRSGFLPSQLPARQGAHVACRRAPWVIGLLLLAGGCAHSGPRMERVALSPSAEADRWEETNRAIYDLNMRADRTVVRPVTMGYRTVVPQAARQGISGLYGTLGEPSNFVNALLQGKIDRAFRAMDRVLVNGALGLGLADHATALGLEEQPNDFGQTLAVWGVSSGPYIMMPFFGPSTVRDGVGFLVDFFGDPVRFAERRLLSPAASLTELGIKLLDTRSQLVDTGEQFLRGSVDEYATVRSAWLQLRRRELFDGAPPDDSEEISEEELLALPPVPAEAEADAPAPPQLSPEPEDRP